MIEEKKKPQVEILSPAGSYESFLAAIHAGADAVYAGGPRFGARAFADNFTEETLKQAIDYAHFHGRKVYLTVNTLLKDREIETLHDYLEPLYLHGSAELIRHDFRIWRFMQVHRCHSVNVKAAQFYKVRGVTRVVQQGGDFSGKRFRSIVQQGWRSGALSMGRCVTAIPASACSAA